MPDKRFGKYTGIVKDNRDDEKRGRLQVSVPSVFSKDELVLADPALPYGVFFVPENESTVWVEFEGGEIGLPIWTGVRHLAGHWAEEAEEDPPRKRVVKSASGQLIILSDTEDDEGIQIVDSVHGHAILINKDGITVNDGVNGHEIALSQDGIALRDGQNNHALIMNDQGVTIESDGDVTITGNSITIEAQSKLAASGNPIHLNP